MPAAEYAVSYSPLSRNIYAGRVSPSRRNVFSSKSLATNMAIGAVAEWLVDNGPSAELTSKTTGKTYRVIVQEVSEDGDQDEVLAATQG